MQILFVACSLICIVSIRNVVIEWFNVLRRVHKQPILEATLTRYGQ